MKNSRFRAKDLKSMAVVIILIIAAAVIACFIVFGKVIPNQIQDRSEQVSSETEDEDGTDAAEDSSASDSQTETESAGEEQVQAGTETEDQAEPAQEDTSAETESEAHSFNVSTVSTIESTGITVSGSQTVYRENLTDVSRYESFVSNNPRFAGSYVASQLYSDVSLETSVDGLKIIFSAEDGSSLIYDYQALSSKNLQEYKDVVAADFSASYTDVTVLSDVYDSDYSKFYAEGIDGDYVVYDLFSAFATGSACRMTLRYPKPTDEEDRIYKEYYAECLYRLSAFSMTEDEPVSFYDYKAAQ